MRSVCPLFRGVWGYPKPSSSFGRGPVHRIASAVRNLRRRAGCRPACAGVVRKLTMRNNNNLAKSRERRHGRTSCWIQRSPHFAHRSSTGISINASRTQVPLDAIEFTRQARVFETAHAPPESIARLGHLCLSTDIAAKSRPNIRRTRNGPFQQSRGSNQTLSETSPREDLHQADLHHDNAAQATIEKNVQCEQQRFYANRDEAADRGKQVV